MSSDRTAGIWSTRLQRELLALTTTVGDKREDAGILPAFLSVKDHDLNIEKGTCNVSFDILVVDDKEDVITSETADTRETKVPHETDDDDTNKQKKAEERNTVEEDGDEAAVSSTAVVTIALIASLGRGPDGSVNQTSMAYPFQKPKAVLLVGAEHLPEASTVKNGDFIDIDCDWTPSLHLNDAALNVALKIRESVRRGEPFNTSSSSLDNKKTSDSGVIGLKSVTSFFSALRQKAVAVVEEIDQVKKATAVAPFAAAATDNSMPPLPKKDLSSDNKTRETVEIGDTIDLSQAPWNANVGMYSCKAIKRPEFVDAAISIANHRDTAENNKVSNPISNDIHDENVVPSGPDNNYIRLKADEIRKVAGVGFAGAGSMFRSLTQSAKTVLEESFIMINNEYVLEIRCNRFSVTTATVTYVIPLSSLAKLKFRRQESISLFLKHAPDDDPLIYMCPESANAVKQIQAVLKRHYGVKGTHTNATTQLLIQSALQMVSDIQAKERALHDDPSLDKVNEIMNLYGQSAENFEAAGDIRHEEVISHMHTFLAKPLTMSILDGSYAAEQHTSGSHGLAAISLSTPTEGEDLDDSLPNTLLETDGNMTMTTATNEDNSHETKKAVKDTSEETTHDNHVKDLGSVNDDDDLNDLLSTLHKKDECTNDFSGTTDDATNIGNQSDVVDTESELEDMLKNADEELAELMNS